MMGPDYCSPPLHSAFQASPPAQLTPPANISGGPNIRTQIIGFRFPKTSLYISLQYRPSRRKPEIGSSANIPILAERQKGRVSRNMFTVDGARIALIPYCVRFPREGRPMQYSTPGMRVQQYRSLACWDCGFTSVAASSRRPSAL